MHAKHCTLKFQICRNVNVFVLTQKRMKRIQCTSTSIKNSTENNLRNKKKIFLRWREYFEDLLNPIRATTTDTCDTIDFGKKEVFTLTEVAAAIQELKCGKAAGEDEI